MRRFHARPLTPDTWPHLEELFGRPGGSVVRGCWCMYYRRSGKQAPGTDNKSELCSIVEAGGRPGLVGYLGGAPVGWISLGPREAYAKLARSPIMKPVDDAQVWSIVCTFVDKAHRGEGLQRRLLRAGIDFARENGARLLEAYPIDKAGRSHDDFMFFGSRSLYERQASVKSLAARRPASSCGARFVRQPVASRSPRGS